MQSGRGIQLAPCPFGLRRVSLAKQSRAPIFFRFVRRRNTFINLVHFFDLAFKHGEEVFCLSCTLWVSVVEAGRDAGYSENTLKGKIFQIVDSPAYKARIEEHIKMAAIQTEEIIGGLVSESRMDLADLFPDDEMLQRAKDMGISHNIKKLKRRPILAGFDPKGTPIWNYEFEVEVYSAHEARKVLTKVFGLKDLPAPKRKLQLKFEAAIDLIMRQAEEAELTTTREAVAEMLKNLPQFKIVFD